MECFFNEKSLPQLHDRQGVNNLFEQFLKVYKCAKNSGVTDLKIHTGFLGHEFAPGITFHSWLHDDTVDQDARTLFKGIMNSTPYLDTIEEDYKEKYNILSMRVDGQPVVGVAIASDYFFDTLSFSFTGTGWDLEKYQPEIEVLIQDENGDLKEDVVTASNRNISLEEHCSLHEDFITQKIQATISSGKELWLKRKDFFPNLIFCEQVKKQLMEFDASTPGFHLVLSRLFDFQRAASGLNGTPVKPEDFRSHTTPESPSREKELGNQLNFLCPDGQYGNFTWHSRFTPGAGRIHFLEEPDKNSITVGYIGKKIGIG